MQQAQHKIDIVTNGKGLVEITYEIAAWLRDQSIRTGLLTAFIQHTSASLLIQENADATVQEDIASFYERVAPEDYPYVHDAEGPDDMPSHIRASLTQTSLGIPVTDGKLALGSWQGVYVFEHRSAMHRRRVVLHLIGE